MSRVIRATHEHEFEAAPGLPEALPAGERIVWQSRPHAGALALQALHIGKVAAYFAVLLAWRVSATWDGTLAHAAREVLPMLPLMALALGGLGLTAWLAARASCYTLTDKRLVMRVGVVLSVTFNLPLRRIEAAELRARPGGRVDIALRLAAGEQIAWLHLWPHARPWRLRRSEPMLRAIPAELAGPLAQMLREAHGGEARIEQLPQRATLVTA